MYNAPADFRYNSVLLIDDNIVDCLINESILKKFQFAKNVTVFHAAQDGLKYLRERTMNPLELPELIFLDLVMPVMDGFGFIRQFQELNPVISKRCKIIVLSAYIDLIDCQRTLEYPFVVSYMSKPLNIEELTHLHIKTQSFFR